MKVASHRAYFLTVTYSNRNLSSVKYVSNRFSFEGPAVRLNYALQMYGLDFLRKYEYTGKNFESSSNVNRMHLQIKDLYDRPPVPLGGRPILNSLGGALFRFELYLLFWFKLKYHS